MNRQAKDPPDSALKADKDDHDAEQVVVAYHERTKHYYHRYSASLGYLDWAQQPDPFRRYNGAPLLRLALPDAGERCLTGTSTFRRTWRPHRFQSTLSLSSFATHSR